MEMAPAGSGDGGGGDDDDHVGMVTQKENITMGVRNEQENTNNPFEEYMWMGNPREEDEVNQQVMEEILEEEFIESCFEDMLEEEALGLFSPPGSNEQDDAPSNNIPSLHSLSIDSGAISDLEGAGPEDDVHVEAEQEQDGVWNNLGAGGVGVDIAAPSGFGGHDSDGETDTSDSDSLGDTPQR